MKKNILILGSGRHQVPLIKKAESLGFRTIVADNLINSPGRKYSSINTLVSSLDYLECKKLALEYKVVGILTAGTDQPVSVMAKISEDLSLPCYISAKGAEIATSKLAQRKLFQHTNILQPRFKALESPVEFDNKWNQFPCIVKPDCSQGQRGITFVKSYGELNNAIFEALNYSNNNAAIVEGFIPGPEFTINVWLNHDEISFFAVSDRITYSRGCMGVCFQHIFPSLAAKNFEGSLRKIVKEIASIFGISDGPLYIQMIATSSGPVLVEAAARIGGGHEVLLFPHIYGFDPIDALLKFFTDRMPATQPLMEDYPKVGLINFVFSNPGKCVTIKDMHYGNYKNIIGGEYYINEGDQLSGMVDGQGRVGYFLASGNDRDEVELSSTSFYDQLCVNNAAGENLVFLPPQSHLLRP